MANTSSLATITQQAGAHVDTRQGWEMPAYFDDVMKEYHSAREGAVLIDRSHQGKVEVSGPDAPNFLHNLCTNDVTNLPLGGGCPAYFCDERGKTLFQTAIYHVRLDGSRNALWVDVTPGYSEPFIQHLDRHLISEMVELRDRTEQFAQLHLAGPRSREVLEKVTGEAIPELAEYLHMERSFGESIVCSIRRHDPLGVPGYDLVLRPEKAEAVWVGILSAGAKPAGLDAFELLRVEAGTPIYGVDIDENRFVAELGDADRAINYDKGCFLGQEPIVMARDRAGGASRAFCGLKLAERIAGAGAKIQREGKEVGVITSSIMSPRCSGPFALGYLRRGHQEPGTQVEVTDEEGSQTAEVVMLPLK